MSWELFLQLCIWTWSISLGTMLKSWLGARLWQGNAWSLLSDTMWLERCLGSGLNVRQVQGSKHGSSCGRFECQTKWRSLLGELVMRYCQPELIWLKERLSEITHAAAVNKLQKQRFMLFGTIQQPKMCGLVVQPWCRNVPLILMILCSYLRC